jgi:hypothetical protein
MNGGDRLLSRTQRYEDHPKRLRSLVHTTCSARPRRLWNTTTSRLREPNEGKMVGRKLTQPLGEGNSLAEADGAQGAHWVDPDKGNVMPRVGLGPSEMPYLGALCSLVHKGYVVEPRENGVK